MFKLFQYKDVFRKLFYTMIILGIYRVVMLIFLPGVDLNILAEAVSKSGFLQTLNVLYGRGIDTFSVLAINIMPYITATIIVQLLSSKAAGISFFRELKTDPNNREMRSAKLNEWTQYFTVILALIHSTYLTMFVYNASRDGVSAVFISKWLFFFISIPSLVAGAMFTLFLAHQISRWGVGQGTSVIIFANIVTSSSSGFTKIWSFFKAGLLGYSHLVTIGLFFVVLFVIVVFVESCTYKVPVIFPGVKGSVLKEIPMKLNPAGVIPSILVSAFMGFPPVLSNLLRSVNFYTESIDKFSTYMSYGSGSYFIVYAILLFVFTVAQTSMVFDPEEIARNLKNQGAVIPGISPGEDTADFLSSKLSKITLLAGVYLIVICVLSEYFCFLFNRSVGVTVLFFGGTSVLILIGVGRLMFQGAFTFYDYGKVVDRFKDKEIKGE